MSVCYSCDECKDFERDQWRNQCVNCICAADQHRDYGAAELKTIKELLQITEDTQPQNSKYSWSPPGLSDGEIEAYMKELPEADRPLKGSKGAVSAVTKLQRQLPLADFLVNQNVCIKTQTEILAFKQFTKDRDENVCSVGNVDTVQTEASCATCNKKISAGSLAVFSDVTDRTWHPDCFRCDECDDLLAELVHCYDDSNIYCVRHFGDLDYNRCHGCDQLIFATEYTKSKGHYYHMEHYNCSQCNNPLTGKRYVLRQDQPTCLPCYEDKFANKCEKCEKAIGTDFKDLSYKGRHWHESCFLCWGCQNSLANQQFVAKDDGLYCPDCYDSNFAQRCDACSNTFKHGMQKFEYNGKKFHHECFTCAECSQPIGNNSFVPKDEGKLVCMPCYNDKFAQKCGKCNEVLLQGGVTFRDTAFHRECFLCTGCDTELANVKFATKDEQPYCPDCYIKTFAKICEKCSQPIAGLGQATKYVAFEGRQWHADCFMCAQCEKSLLGQGFLVCNNLVVCPDCGKNM